MVGGEEPRRLEGHKGQQKGQVNLLHHCRRLVPYERVVVGLVVINLPIRSTDWVFKICGHKDVGGDDLAHVAPT